MCCGIDFEDDWKRPYVLCCLPSKSKSGCKSSLQPTPQLVSQSQPVSDPDPARTAESVAQQTRAILSDEDIHASLDDLFPDIAGDYDKQLRVLRAQSLCTSLPSFAGAAIMESAAGTGKNSIGTEIEPEIVVPGLRDEMIYDLVGTTFGVCKMCFAEEKTIRMEPCGHMCCTHCKDSWDSKIALHGSKLNLPSPTTESESICPFCHANVVDTVAVKIKSRAGGSIPPSNSNLKLARPKAVSPLKSCTTLPHMDPIASLSIFKTPSTWDPVSEQDYALKFAKVFPLNLREQEAGVEVAAFLGSLVDDPKIDVAKVNVIAVKRIQNMALYQSFCCLRKTIISRHQHYEKSQALDKAKAAARSTAVWEVKIDRRWTKYDDHVAAEIEQAYRSFAVQRGPSFCRVNIAGRGSFCITFSLDSNHTQKSDSYGTVRNVRRWAPYACAPDISEHDTTTNHGPEDFTESLVERKLYHGTSIVATEKIIRQGFNRSFAGQHGTRFGRGVYFAKNAGYATHPTYSPPDSWGIKRVLVCRVLTGDSCQGNPGQRIPDVLDAATGRLYDSTVDSVTNPSIFVTFNDAQAYPTHSIEFEIKE